MLYLAFTYRYLQASGWLGPGGKSVGPLRHRGVLERQDLPDRDRSATIDA